MTAIKAKDLVAALTRKGMSVMSDAGDHHTMLCREYDNGPKLITRVSHGSRVQYDDYLLGLVGRQLALRLGELKDLVRCPLTTEAWDELVAQRCPDGVNPWAPFRRNG